MSAPEDSGLLFSALLIAAFATVGVHAALGFAVHKTETDIATVSMAVADFRYVAPRPVKMRNEHGGVSFERRRATAECTSIPECNPELESQVIELKIAKLGMKDPDPKKLPEIQKYEESEKEELSVNVEKDPTAVKPLQLKDFLKKKKQLDRRRKKRKPKLRRDLFNLDNDPRARPTRFEEITGRLEGDIYGKGMDTAKFDQYFGRLALELHKVFHPPTSLTRKQIQKQRVRIKITRMSVDGTVLAYRVLRKAKKDGFTQSAVAALREFVPAEGGRRQLPSPPADILEFVNKKGVIVDLDGRLFQ